MNRRNLLQSLLALPLLFVKGRPESVKGLDLSNHRSWTAKASYSVNGETVRITSIEYTSPDGERFTVPAQEGNT